ncbi:MAG: hypothetical protein AAF658_05160 [Myxococcota bacterium]
MDAGAIPPKLAAALAQGSLQVPAERRGEPAVETALAAVIGDFQDNGGDRTVSQANLAQLARALGRSLPAGTSIMSGAWASGAAATGGAQSTVQDEEGLFENAGQFIDKQIAENPERTGLIFGAFVGLLFGGPLGLLLGGALGFAGGKLASGGFEGLFGGDDAESPASSTVSGQLAGQQVPSPEESDLPSEGAS